MFLWLDPRPNVIVGQVNLLAQHQLLSTGPVDHADWNYLPVIGMIQRMRFRLIARLLGERRFESLLEIGYGSGIFMPELGKRAGRLAGIDIHERHREVAGVLAANGLEADLRAASMTDIPFRDASFDCAIAISTLEFVDDIGRASAEIARVLKPGGELLVVTPRTSRLLDFGLWVLTRQSAKNDFAGRRERVVPALQKHFTIGREIRTPLYRALRMVVSAPDQSIRQADKELSVRT